MFFNLIHLQWIHCTAFHILCQEVTGTVDTFSISYYTGTNVPYSVGNHIWRNESGSKEGKIYDDAY